jgi:hypothetical protein
MWTIYTKVKEGSQFLVGKRQRFREKKPACRGRPGATAWKDVQVGMSLPGMIAKEMGMNLYLTVQCGFPRAKV